MWGSTGQEPCYLFGETNAVVVIAVVAMVLSAMVTATACTVWVMWFIQRRRRAQGLPDLFPAIGAAALRQPGLTNEELAGIDVVIYRRVAGGDATASSAAASGNAGSRAAAAVAATGSVAASAVGFVPPLSHAVADGFAPPGVSVDVEGGGTETRNPLPLAAAAPAAALAAASAAQPAAEPDGLRRQVTADVGVGGDTCCVCIDTFDDGDELLELPCGHRFHGECIKPWLQTSVQCPMCKCDVRRALGGGGLEPPPTPPRRGINPQAIELVQLGGGAAAAPPPPRDGGAVLGEPAAGPWVPQPRVPPPPLSPLPPLLGMPPQQLQRPGSVTMLNAGRAAGGSGGGERLDELLLPPMEAP